jgi:hypothetical protein
MLCYHFKAAQSKKEVEGELKVIKDKNTLLGQIKPHRDESWP